MKKGLVKVNNLAAGYIEQVDEGFRFQYTSEYLALPDAQAVSLTLPIQNEPYISNVLFPFFDGLIPEGWLLNIAVNSWKISERDRISLLLTCCEDCLGNVSVHEVKENTV